MCTMAGAMGKFDQMVGIPIERRILAEFFCIIQPAIDSDRLLLLAERVPRSGQCKGDEEGRSLLD
uniref:Uncharacterized protein n=1 Tax=Triticum urartu TaxID=4572 RepID=A0A8R7QIJ7_TRIUA